MKYLANFEKYFCFSKRIVSIIGIFLFSDVIFFNAVLEQYFKALRMESALTMNGFCNGGNFREKFEKNLGANLVCFLKTLFGNCHNIT